MSGDSYTGALEAAGAVVHECKWFGSYQGTWIAYVTLPDGRTGLIEGYYGSCSGCDAFEAEFGYDWHQHEKHPDVDFDENCEECTTRRDRLATFGAAYFESFQDVNDAAQNFHDEQSYWSSYGEDREQAEFILAHATDEAAKAVLIERMNSKED